MKRLDEQTDYSKPVTTRLETLVLANQTTLADHETRIAALEGAAIFRTYEASLSGGSTTIGNGGSFDFTDGSTVVFAPRRSAMGRSPGTLEVAVADSETLTVTSTDGSDDGTVVVAVYGVLLT